MRECFSQLACTEKILSCPPQAVARIQGGPGYPHLRGLVRFYERRGFVLLAAEIHGLPDGFFAFHIHAGPDCGGQGFSDSGVHYDQAGREHPNHAGDLPPLLSCDRLALSVFQTRRFSLREVLGRTIIVHQRPDDFRTQPSGDAGEKIACGEIRPCRG